MDSNHSTIFEGHDQSQLKRLQITQNTLLLAPFAIECGERIKDVISCKGDTAKSTLHQMPFDTLSITI